MKIIGEPHYRKPDYEQKAVLRKIMERIEKTIKRRFFGATRRREFRSLRFVDYFAFTTRIICITIYWEKEYDGLLIGEIRFGGKDGKELHMFIFPSRAGESSRAREQNQEALELAKVIDEIEPITVVYGNKEVTKTGQGHKRRNG